MSPGERYASLRRALEGERLPAALVLLDAFDRNLERMLAPLRGTGKTLRIATKSIRVPALVRRALDRAGPLARGLMTYAAAETAFLAAEGYRDLLLAYPTVRAPDLEALTGAAKRGARVRVVVDDAPHVAALGAAARAAGVTLEAVIELDVSFRPLERLHIGVRRSPIRDARSALALARTIASEDGLRLGGVMAYEAHIAGLTDRSPFTPLQNPARRLLKLVAYPRAAALRAEVVRAIERDGHGGFLVNGGGTGSLSRTAGDASVTEVTVGSGLFAPHLFDYYAGLALEPAALLACQVVRASDPGFVTCHGGGYVASGAAGADRLPRPWLPEGLELTPLEGAGEVQTPLRTDRCEVALQPGDPVLFRHAKAGEAMEHFAEALLIEGDRIVERAPTYRGRGLAAL